MKELLETRGGLVTSSATVSKGACSATTQTTLSPSLRLVYRQVGSACLG